MRTIFPTTFFQISLYRKAFAQARKPYREWYRGLPLTIGQRLYKILEFIIIVIIIIIIIIIIIVIIIIIIIIIDVYTIHCDFLLDLPEVCIDINIFFL